MNNFSTKIKTDGSQKGNIECSNLDGPNWGIYTTHLQGAARILDCWDVTKGEISSQPGQPITFDRLDFPTNAIFKDPKDLVVMIAAWNKKNAQAMGLIQTTMAPALWINYTHFSRAHELWVKLKQDFGKAGGASTYLQMVNMVKIEFTDSTELLPQIQQFLEN